MPPGEVLEEAGVHCTFEPDVKLSDFSFCKCHNANACKTHQFEERGDMLLIATDAIERLGEDNVELAFARTRGSLVRAARAGALRTIPPLRL
jgi:hypothetical protein